MTHNEMPKDTVEETLLQRLQREAREKYGCKHEPNCQLVGQYHGLLTDLEDLDEIIANTLKEASEEYEREKGEMVREERERIENVFKEAVPPHPMDLEDSVWLKRLLNKAFNHDKNV